MLTARCGVYRFCRNKVEIVYCDGGSYSGNNETVGRVSFGGIDNRPLYYRGQRNLEAAIDYLATEHGMDAASHLVVSGDSAGGLATYWHADWFQTRLPKTNVKPQFCVPCVALYTCGAMVRT